MKNIFVICVCSICTATSWAQTSAEWFNQKKTQKKYLLENIAALKVYAGYLQKGYSIAKKGLNTIEGFKKGDFNLHSEKFAALGIVNPKVKHYARVAEIIAMQVTIARTTARSLRQCSNTNLFRPDEVAYLHSTYDRLLDDCARALDELSDVVTNGKEQMKDDERIKRIDALYLDMKGRQVFVQAFANSAAGLAVQRNNDFNDITISRKINAMP